MSTQALHTDPKPSLLTCTAGLSCTALPCATFVVLLQVLQSLAFLHSLGLVHSDLKPENILIKSYSRWVWLGKARVIAVPGMPQACLGLMGCHPGRCSPRNSLTRM